MSNAAVRSQNPKISLKDVRNVPLTETSAANVRMTMISSMASAYLTVVPSSTIAASARLMLAQNAKKRSLSKEVSANAQVEI